MVAIREGEISEHARRLNIPGTSKTKKNRSEKTEETRNEKTEETRKQSIGKSPLHS
jgi:hypothetical protein